MNEAIGMVLRDGAERVTALPPGFAADEVSLSVKDGVAWDDYDRVGGLLSALVDHNTHSLPWIVGDFLAAGQRLFPERYHQACKVTGWSIGTVMNYERTAARVPPENRWKDGKPLPIRFGMNVAKLPPKDQKRILAKTEREGLSWRESLRLTNGDPDYKANAVPEKGATRHERMLSAFERVYHANEQRLQEYTLKDGHRFMWELCSRMSEELSY